jgi:hypothetical protein
MALENSLKRELWVLGIKPGSDRGEQICSYLSRVWISPRLEAGKPEAGGL